MAQNARGVHNSTVAYDWGKPSCCSREAYRGSRRNGSNRGSTFRFITAGSRSAHALSSSVNAAITVTEANMGQGEMVGRHVGASWFCFEPRDDCGSLVPGSGNGFGVRQPCERDRFAVGTRGRCQLDDRFIGLSRAQQRHSEKAPRRHEPRVHIQHIAAALDSLRKLSRSVTHPRRVRRHDETEGIDVTRAVGFSVRFPESRHRCEKLGVEAMRRFAAGRQRNRRPILVFGRAPIPFERATDLCEGKMCVGNSRIDFNRSKCRYPRLLKQGTARLCRVVRERNARASHGRVRSRKIGVECPARARSTKWPAALPRGCRDSSGTAL